VAGVEELLREAARGHLGVDQRFIRTILDSGEAACAELVRFARTPRDEHRVDLDLVLTDLFRHYRCPEAIDFFVDAIRRSPEDVPDSLAEAVFPLGEKAVEPLIALYEEVGEEQGSDVAFLLAGLRVRDPRVLQLLLDRLEFDASDGAFCLGLYGDPSARPALEKTLAEIPKDETKLRQGIERALAELDSPGEPYEPPPFDIFAEYPEYELPPFEVLPEAERIEMFSSPDPKVRAGAAHSFFNAELHPKTRSALLTLAKSDPEPDVRGRAWESLADAATEENKDASIRDAMISVLNDAERPVEERGRALRRCRPRRRPPRHRGAVRRRRQSPRQGARSHVALAVGALRELLRSAS
jgi:HEAT repeat protein